jgi:alkylmercury lyase
MAAERALEVLAARLGGALPTLDTGEQEVAMTLLRLLGEGEPVPTSRLAAAVGEPPDALEEQLTRLSGLLFRDDRGRVIGFMGLSVIEMGRHRVHVDGRALSAWCAWDTLFLPELLGRTAGVSSRCPITGEEISLNVGVAGVADLDPAETVVSFMVPDKRLGDDVIRSFCHFVHFFASEQAGRQRTLAHDGAFLLSVADAYQLGRLTNRAAFGAALAGSPRCRGDVRA